MDIALSHTKKTSSNITFCVLSYSFFDMTARCIDSILSFEKDALILLADNRSPDNTYVRLSHRYRSNKQVKIYGFEANFGVAKGRNMLGGMVETDMLVFIDNDAYITSSISNAVMDKLSQKNIGAYGVPLLLDDKLRCYNQDVVNTSVDAIGGALFAVRTALFKELGGFDESYGLFGHEDIDFCLALKSQGYSIIGNAKLPFVHEDHHSSSLLPDKDILEAKTQQRLFEKWGDKQHLLEIERQHIDYLSCVNCPEVWKRH